MTDRTADRIARALERIADLMTLLTVEPTPQPAMESEELPCPHLERMALGSTNGWVCMTCQYLENPS
ncbi:hypothetical protein UFOVP1236_38 [uncultured Caudovirales phage]|uniref:Uncharacterized protein n=1 Tax=uncultured Caudovirales phage TaxID=2100421 RepID=A0A6J5RL20_9CAUD|nr:hypothetical protein UFOVP1236_38 [uncultured Caudovirales phage]